MNSNESNNTPIIIAAVVGIVVVAAGAYAYMNNSAPQDDAMMDTTETTMDAPPAADGEDAMMGGESMEGGEEGVMVGGAMMVPSKDIVDNAVEADNVTTLVAAVQAAGLVETLKGEGPFTVFAPTNAAFEKLPEGTVDTLLLPENKDQLTGVLTYHVVAGRYTAADLTDGMTLTTVQGQTLTITMENGAVMVNGEAMVETADVISSNGVTHVIDTVLLPQ